MQVLDRRSGKFVEVGDWLHYPDDPEATWSLLEVRPGLFSATLVILDHRMHIAQVLAPIGYFSGSPKGVEWRCAIAPT